MLQSKMRMLPLFGTLTHVKKYFSSMQILNIQMIVFQNFKMKLKKIRMNTENCDFVRACGNSVF